VNKKLLSYLACPGCRQKLRLKTQRQLLCLGCGRTYAVEHGIPVLLDRDGLPAHLLSQIKYFESESQEYGAVYSLGAWQERYVTRFMKNIGVCKGKVIVDDACGSGYISIEAAKRGAMVVSCDLNMAALVRLQRVASQLGLGDRVCTVCCSSESLPVNSNIAHAVAANAILEHLPDEEKAIEEIFRVSKRGAIALITVPIAYHLLNPFFLLLNYVYDKRIGHLRRYTLKMLRTRFSGWDVRRVFYSGHTAKVWKTLINIILPVFDVEKIEAEDERHMHQALFATNIGIIVKKK